MAPKAELQLPLEPIDAHERELLELLVVYPETWAAARAALLPAQLASSALRRIYETGCRLLDAGVLPGFERLILEFDEPALKSLLVDLDEQGRAKGSRMAEPAGIVEPTLEVTRTKGGRQAVARHHCGAARTTTGRCPGNGTAGESLCSRNEAGKAFRDPRKGNDALARAITCQREHELSKQR